MTTSGKQNGTSRAPGYTPRVGDVLLALLIAVVSLILLLSPRGGAASEHRATVSRDGIELTVLPLDVPTVYDTGGNVIRVENGTARVESADCPDRLCVAMGAISGPGESIVCLPNRLIVTVGGDADVDAVSG